MFSRLTKTAISMAQLSKNVLDTHQIIIQPRICCMSPVLSSFFSTQNSLRVRSDNMLDFVIKREGFPQGHKQLAPGVKYKSRIGEATDANYYRRIIHYPKDGKYTIRKLRTTKLAGRDPKTGRKVVYGYGGGHKQKFRMVDWLRFPKDRNPEEDLFERVIDIRYDPCRNSKLALTGYGSHLRWQLATENMRKGDIICTTTKIPPIEVKPVLGNGYPLGALPVGSAICLIQKQPGSEEVKAYDAEASVKIVSKAKGKVHVNFPNNWTYAFDEKCQCVAGKVSIHPLKKCAIGSPNRYRWMGFFPRSGLWHRKTGRFGRKIKKPPPVIHLDQNKSKKPETLLLNSVTEGLRGKIRGKKRKFRTGLW